MAKFCSNCGKELNENADICLNCGVVFNGNDSRTTDVNNGKKKRMPGWAIALIIVSCLIPIIVFGLIIVLIFSIPDVSMDKAKEVHHRYKSEYEDNYIVVSEGTIEDTLNYNGLSFTLNRVESFDSIGDDTSIDGDEYIVFFLDIVNNSEEVKKISMINFEGTSDFDSDIPEVNISDSIDGVNSISFVKRLSAGDKISGYVAFEVEKDWTSYELIYHDLFDNTAISFSVINDKVNRA